MPRIRITEKGWAGFTGNMGTAIFENGEAEVSELEALRFGASIQITRIDADGVEVDQISPSLDITRTKSLSATVVAPLAADTATLLTPLQSDADIDKSLELFTNYLAAAGLHFVKTEADPAFEGTTKVTTVKIYTRDELEKIGDAAGIKGLREVADVYGIKSTAIATLIDGILEAQLKE